MISGAGTFARFSSIRKCILLLTFWITYMTWQFHWSVLVMVTPNNLTLSMRSSSWEFTVTASKWCLTFFKSITSSLHLSAFSWSLLTIDHCSTALTASCIPLWSPLGTTSASVVSSIRQIQEGEDHWSLKWKAKGQVLCPGARLMEWSPIRRSNH